MGDPAEILEAAPESPFGFPAELFVRRGERSIDDAARPEPTPTTERAQEALGDGGTVLDVGVGGGATCLPLAARCTSLVAVDGQADMLEAITRLARGRSLQITTVQGRWPDVAPRDASGRRRRLRPRRLQRARSGCVRWTSSPRTLGVASCSSSPSVTRCRG